MLPSSLAGMVAGGMVAMFGAVGAIASGDGLWDGAAFGLLCLAYTYYWQGRLYGEAA